MTGAILVGVAVLVALACTALAWSHPRRVLGATRADVTQVTAALRRVPAAERVRALLNRAEPGTWEHELAVDVLAAPDPDARIAAANLALADMEHALGRTAGWPRAGLRIGLLGHAFLALSAYLVSPAEPQRILAILVVGGASALACVEARRRGEREAARRREAVDALLGVAFPDGQGVPVPGAVAPVERELQARWLGGLVALPDDDPPRPRRSERRARRAHRRRGLS